MLVLNDFTTAFQAFFFFVFWAICIRWNFFSDLMVRVASRAERESREELSLTERSDHTHVSTYSL